MSYEKSCKYYCVVFKNQQIKNIYITNTSTINYFNNSNNELLSYRFIHFIFRDIKEALGCNYFDVCARHGKSVRIL